MHIKQNKITRVLLYPIIFMGEWLGMHYPLLYMKIRYFVRFGRFPDLKDPSDLNEKILWLYFNSDTSDWSRLTDKLVVRSYVESKGYSSSLTNVYAVWRRAEDFDVSTLPDSFVLKCNNGSGTVLLVQSKSQLNIDSAKRLMNRWLKKKDFGYEYHYRKIENKLYAEEYLMHESDSCSIVDYKFWCFNGIPKYVWVCTNRTRKHVDTMIYDMQWNAYPQYLNCNSSYREGCLILQPKSFDTMKRMAADLSASFPIVRVDLYEVQGKVYFGEMTFTSVGGMNNQYSDEFLLLAGNLIKLDNDR